MWSINLRAPVYSESGYGKDGIGLARAFSRRAMVSLQPTFIAPPIPLDVAEMLTVSPPENFDLLVHHVSPLELGLTQGHRERTEQCVAWTMWEYPSFAPEVYEDVKARLTGYDAVVVYDETSAEAIRSLKTDVPILILQGGYDPEEWSTVADPQRNWHSEEFVFVIAGDLTPRKAPYTAARVIQRLSDEGYKVRLKMKTWSNSPALAAVTAAYSAVDFYSGSKPQSWMRDLYGSAHCYLGPSWGEGKNLPAIEAGTTGAALILSDCGGHRQWARPEFAITVPGTMNKYADMPYLEVDEEALYEACKTLVENRALAKRMGTQAAAILPYQMSWNRVTQDFLLLAARQFKQ